LNAGALVEDDWTAERPAAGSDWPHVLRIENNGGCPRVGGVEPDRDDAEALGEKPNADSLPAAAGGGAAQVRERGAGDRGRPLGDNVRPEDA